jgi:hypothetical protein
MSDERSNIDIDDIGRGVEIHSKYMVFLGSVGVEPYTYDIDLPLAMRGNVAHYII